MVRKILQLSLVTLVTLACNNSNNKSQNENQTITNSADTITISEENNEQTKPTFDIEVLPVSTHDIGDFPFLTLPKGLKNQNIPLVKDFDVCFFPIGGVMTPIEGKLYKTNVVGEGNGDFPQRYYEKSLEDYLLAVGAVKIFEGKITEDEYNRYNQQDPNKGKDGDIGYTDQFIKVYALRTADKNIYIQSSANNASGKLNILEQQAFNQTITKVTSDKIADDLFNKGKSVLHINFDTNKATLKADGREIIAEIIKVLEQNPELKIAINGHTDNMGNKEHNQKLSQTRADAVKSELVKAGISADRLTAKGFGQENPITNNDTETRRASNRRVELVKL
ncbi:OmpA family protein [Bergeyella zoohelcum]|uniref:Root adhesin n=1 Tax=Bergeyella zoohelcum TaxID=1015 RepID=A0A376C2R9_9FLAO|nr:OmpA family protein [Bergeyella zoohelcum]EKB58262.1 hypothetical protein HMPREF9700_02070 [Bergeyella zoohelcum CCUG 30536]SSZ55795.1 Root adhesin [Bergeyella zoohelcum]